MFYISHTPEADVPQAPVCAQRGNSGTTDTLWLRTTNERSSYILECTWKCSASVLYGEAFAKCWRQSRTIEYQRTESGDRKGET